VSGFSQTAGQKLPVKSKKIQWNLISLIMAIYEILIVGAASSRDYAMIGDKATFFRGWKPFPRGIDVILVTLTPDLLRLHNSVVLLLISCGF
jgi:hypothetical protein